MYHIFSIFSCCWTSGLVLFPGRYNSAAVNVNEQIFLWHIDAVLWIYNQESHSQVKWYFFFQFVRENHFISIVTAQFDIFTS